jgi:hypothetical protein
VYALHVGHSLVPKGCPLWESTEAAYRFFLRLGGGFFLLWEASSVVSKARVFFAFKLKGSLCFPEAPPQAVLGRLAHVTAALPSHRALPDVERSRFLAFIERRNPIDPLLA